MRGYEYAKGKHLVIDPAELDQLRPARDRALRLDRFVAPGSIDPVLLAGRSLYLAPKAWLLSTPTMSCAK